MCLHRRKGRISVASIDAIPFADARFDLVTAFDVVCQLPSPRDEVCLAELSRVMKPRGKDAEFKKLDAGSSDEDLHKRVCGAAAVPASSDKAPPKK